MGEKKLSVAFLATVTKKKGTLKVLDVQKEHVVFLTKSTNSCCCWYLKDVCLWYSKNHQPRGAWLSNKATTRPGYCCRGLRCLRAPFFPPPSLRPFLGGALHATAWGSGLFLAGFVPVTSDSLIR